MGLNGVRIRELTCWACNASLFKLCMNVHWIGHTSSLSIQGELDSFQLKSGALCGGFGSGPFSDQMLGIKDPRGRLKMLINITD